MVKLDHMTAAACPTKMTIARRDKATTKYICSVTLKIKQWLEATDNTHSISKSCSQLMFQSFVKGGYHCTDMLR